MENDWKSRLGVVYSTNPDFSYESERQEEEATLPPREQKLIISLDKKNRKGKAVTLISGFRGREDDLKELGKIIKTHCGSGGTVKDGEILIQGDFRDKIQGLLESKGYRPKRSGG
ncbi:MAG: translation initiation factor [Bacteroidota bacterium]